MREPDFAAQIALRVKQYAAYPNAATELANIVAALTTDLTTHSKVIETPVSQTLWIHHALNTPFTNDINLIINKGKAGNLTTNQMISGISDAIGVAHVPAIIDVPYVSGPKPYGGVLNCTTGNWTGAPTGYAYAWKRDGATAIGSNSASYTTVLADQGHQVGCIVTATNLQGSTAAPISNQIGVT